MLYGMATMIIRAHSRGPRWDGALRGWIESRARQLRDEAAVHAVVVVEGSSDGGVAYWEIGIRFADLGTGDDVVLRRVLSDLELLRARPELVTEADIPELRAG